MAEVAKGYKCGNQAILRVFGRFQRRVIFNILKGKTEKMKGCGNKN